MSDIEDMLERQSAWQKSRKNLGWYEKILMVERIRASVESLRRSAVPRPAPGIPPADEDPGT